MVSTLAYLAALAFWIPYNGGHMPACHLSDVQVYDRAPTELVGRVGYDPLGYAPDFGRRSCSVAVSRDLTRLPVMEQCAVLAHEIGHAWFSLEDVPVDGWSVMGGATPWACRPPDWWGKRGTVRWRQRPRLP